MYQLCMGNCLCTDGRAPYTLPVLLQINVLVLYSTAFEAVIGIPLNITTEKSEQSTLSAAQNSLIGESVSTKGNLETSTKFATAPTTDRINSVDTTGSGPNRISPSTQSNALHRSEANITQSTAVNETTTKRTGMHLWDFTNFTVHA
ncbi:unnamed protein product [Toxocara canis]|uniref:Uncharacterized protein n=1 Tax=Toxocara canis TaxID=6265 RepID=A0A183UR21_TOXCA|nr:unnamed protein product [Toxocara canis]